MGNFCLYSQGQGHDDFLLSPIDNFWGIVVRQAYVGGWQFNTCEEPADAVQSAWTKIDADNRQSLLIRSMHDRCLQVVLQQGGKIPYWLFFDAAAYYFLLTYMYFLV